MQDRIIKIKEYFKGLEICDGIVIIKTVFPTKWVIPSASLLDELFKVKAVENKLENGYFYCCEIEVGVLPAFDAIDFTIEFNRNLEEKSELLKEKVNELKTLFAEKPIEVLRTIEFKFTEKKNKTRKNKNVETEVLSNNEEIVTSQVVDNTNYETVNVENNIENIEGDNLMEYAIELIKN